MLVRVKKSETHNLTYIIIDVIKPPVGACWSWREKGEGMRVRSRAVLLSAQNSP